VAEEEARRAVYQAEVAAGKLATVSQLVKGEGGGPAAAAGSVSPGRSHSPGDPADNCRQPVTSHKTWQLLLEVPPLLRPVAGLSCAALDGGAHQLMSLVRA